MIGPHVKDMIEDVVQSDEVIQEGGLKDLDS